MDTGVQEIPFWVGLGMPKALPGEPTVPPGIHRYLLE